MAISQEEEFEFRLRLEQEMAAQASPDMPEPEPEPTLLEKGTALAKSAGRGLAGGIQSLSEISNMAQTLPVTHFAKAFAPEEQAPVLDAMGDAFMQRTADVSPVTTITEGMQTALPRTIGKQSPEFESAMTGTEFAGSAAIPFTGPLKMAKEALLFGGGGALGDYISGGDEDAALIGGIGGSTRGFMLPQVMQNMYEATRRAFGSGAAQTSEAEKIILAYADDAETATTNLREAMERGERGTFGQLSQDKGILALENSAASDPVMSRQLQRVNEEITQGAVENIRGVSDEGADIADLQRVAQEQTDSALAQTRQALEQRLQGATQRAQEQLSEAATTAKQQEQAAESAFTQTRQKMIDEAEKSLRDTNVRRLNDAAPPDYTITESGAKGITQLRESFDKAYTTAWEKVKKLPKRTQADFKRVANANYPKLTDDSERKIIENLLDEMDDVIAQPSGDKVKAFSQRLRNHINSAASGDKMQYQLYETLKELRSALRNGLPANAREELAAIDGQYGNYLTVQRAAANAKARGGVFNDEELLNASSVIGGVERTAEQTAPLMKQALANQGAFKQGQQQVKQSEKAQADYLAQLNTQAQAEQKAIEKGLTAESQALRKLQEQEAKAITSTPTARVAETERPVRVLGKVLDGDKPITDMRQIATTAAADESGAAIKGLRAGVVDDLVNRLSKEGVLKKDAATRFDNVVDSLGDVFTPQEIERLQTAAKESDKIYARAGIKASEIPEAAQGLGFYLASIVGLNVGSIMATNPLMGAALGKQVATKYANRIPHQKVMEKMNDILLNPNDYADDLARLSEKGVSKETINDVVQRWFGPLVQGTED